jgi:hypothetical protein
MLTPSSGFEVYMARSWLSYLGNIFSLKEAHLFSALFPSCDEKCGVPLKESAFLPTVPTGLDQAPFPYPCLCLQVSQTSLQCACVTAILSPYTLWPWRQMQCVPVSAYKTTWCHDPEDHNLYCTDTSQELYQFKFTLYEILGSHSGNKITVFSDVTPCSLVNGYKRFGRTYCLPLQAGRSSSSYSTLKMQAGGSFNMWCIHLTNYMVLYLRRS